MKNKHTSAGIVPIRFTNNEAQYLLLRCYTYWDFPKGGLEDKETAFQAAIRETSEESGILEESLDFLWGFDYYETESYGKNKTAKYFLASVSDSAIVELKSNPETGKPEHQEFKWFSYEEAVKVVNGRILGVLDWAKKLSTNQNTV